MTAAPLTTDALPELLTYDEAATVLRRSARTVRRLVARGHLRIVTPGDGRPLIDRESVRAMVRASHSRT